MEPKVNRVDKEISNKEKVFRKENFILKQRCVEIQKHK